MESVPWTDDNVPVESQPDADIGFGWKDSFAADPAPYAFESNEWASAFNEPSPEQKVTPTQGGVEDESKEAGNSSVDDPVIPESEPSGTVQSEQLHQTHLEKDADDEFGSFDHESDGSEGWGESTAVQSCIAPEANDTLLGTVESNLKLVFPGLCHSQMEPVASSPEDTKHVLLHGSSTTYQTWKRISSLSEKEENVFRWKGSALESQVLSIISSWRSEPRSAQKANARAQASAMFGWSNKGTRAASIEDAPLPELNIGQKPSPSGRIPETPLKENQFSGPPCKPGTLPPMKSPVKSPVPQDVPADEEDWGAFTKAAERESQQMSSPIAPEQAHRSHLQAPIQPLRKNGTTMEAAKPDPHYATDTPRLGVTDSKVHTEQENVTTDVWQGLDMGIFETSPRLDPGSAPPVAVSAKKGGVQPPSQDGIQGGEDIFGVNARRNRIGKGSKMQQEEDRTVERILCKLPDINWMLE